jgi:predicted exporter
LTLIMVPALLPRRRPAVRPRTLTMPRLAAWIGRRRTAVVVTALVVTAVLGAFSVRLHINPTLDRLRSATDAALLETKIASTFGLPGDVYIALAHGPSLELLLESNERLTARLRQELPGLAVQAPTMLLPSDAAQTLTAAAIQKAALTPDGVRASLEQARAAAGFKPGSFDPFVSRLAVMFDTSQRLTYDGYMAHGLADVVNRFVVRRNSDWLLVTYAFPGDAVTAERLNAIASEDPAVTLTGLPLVNRELADRFLPQFLKGLAIGTLMVVLLVIAAFRDLKLSLFALLPTVIGLIWTAGILAALGIDLDLFALFAVVTFLGIGVDYGIHLVHRFKEHGDAERATAELAPVILVAGAITVLGYGTLINSSYPPLRSIGVVSGVSVLALAAASVMVLPALLRMKTP